MAPHTDHLILLNLSIFIVTQAFPIVPEGNTIRYRSHA